MKIGIITNTPTTNYGGILQAFALQHILKKMGHSVLTVKISGQKRETWLKKSLRFIKLAYNRYLRGRKDLDVRFHLNPSNKILSITTGHLAGFIKRHIDFTDEVDMNNAAEQLGKYHFDAYVVGSDQIWLPKYIPFSLLSFLDGQIDVKRIAYAPSIGRSDWFFSPQETRSFKTLIPKFDYLSVREDSLVQLIDCQTGRLPEYVLDPTLLISAEEYSDLFHLQEDLSDSYIFVYILDYTPEKKAFIDHMAQRLGCSVRYGMPKKFYMRVNLNHVEDAKMISVESWLSSIKNAAYVITDSFHGMVFSFLFEKEFWVLNNKKRGNARFLSFLNLFHIESRLLDFPYAGLDESSLAHMDYAQLKSMYLGYKNQSIKFLNQINNE